MPARLTPAAADRLAVSRGRSGSPPSRGAGAGERAWLAVTLAALVLILAELVFGLLPASRTVPWVGHDYRLYIEAAQRWMTGGPFYEPYQLSGPYLVHEKEILYPPIILALLVPLTLMPAALWWLIPSGIVVWITWAWRPAPWAWATIALLLALPITPPARASWAMDVIANGNPAIWVVALVALATRWPVFGAFALLKPTLAPFALIGIRNCRWWYGLAALGLLCLAFAPMWPAYLDVARNAQTTGSPLLYSLNNVPLLLVPIVAWLGAISPRSQRRERQPWWQAEWNDNWTPSRTSSGDRDDAGAEVGVGGPPGDIGR